MYPKLKILRPHGINGYVRVFLYETVLDGDVVFDRVGQTFVVQRYNKDNETIKFFSVNDRTEAENLKGNVLFAKKEPLTSGNYYASDLIGLSIGVLGGTQECKIVGIQNYGAGDILELCYESKTILIPFRHEFFNDDLSIKKETIDSFLLLDR